MKYFVLQSLFLRDCFYVWNFSLVLPAGTNIEKSAGFYFITIQSALKRRINPIRTTRVVHNTLAPQLRFQPSSLITHDRKLQRWHQNRRWSVSDVLRTIKPTSRPPLSNVPQSRLPVRLAVWPNRPRIKRQLSECVLCSELVSLPRQPGKSDFIAENRSVKNGWLVWWKYWD